MTTITQDIETLRLVLRDSEDVKNFCNQKYGKLHTVYVGINPQNPPVAENAPCLVIIAVKTERQISLEKRYIGIGIMVNRDIIAENVITISNSPIVQQKDYVVQGFLEAEELREKVQDAIVKSKKFLKPQFDSESIPNEVFPIFTTTTNLVIDEVISSRS